MASLKKCIVLDLDNTLWGGVIGEDGMDGIALSLKHPGNSFMAFQQALLDHYDRGILLAINSRNNPPDAWQVIRTHPWMILKEQHFAAVRMNWNDKVENLKELAKELNIGLDSMVFFDDDETNRAMVCSLLPEVATPDLPKDPAEYVRFLNSLDYFPAEAVTDEDKMRGNLYVTERLRKEEEKNHENKEDFLAHLNLELSVYEDTASSIARLAQMTEKTNQFNNDKQPFSEKEIEEYIKNPNHKVFHGQLSDKFGDYGIIIFALIDIQGKVWHIRSMLMSCRVFGRNVEDAFLGVIMKRAKENGAKRVTIGFRKTEKNTPAEEFIKNRFAENMLATSTNFKIPAWIKLHTL